MFLRKIIRLFSLVIFLFSLLGLGLYLGKFYVLPKYTIDQATEPLKKVNDKKIIHNTQQVKKSSKVYQDIYQKYAKELKALKKKNIDPKYDVNDNHIIDSEEEKLLGIRIPGAIHYKGDFVENSEYADYNPYISYDHSNVRSIRTIPLDARINPDLMVGQIYVPAVGLRLAIMEGISNQNLNLASGTMKPGQRMGYGNYAIAGHHMQDPRLLFTPLMNAQKGNKVYLSDGHKVYEYKINEIFVVSPSHVEIDDDIKGRKTVTLMLCEDLYSVNRRIIRGDLVKVYKLSNVSNELRQNLTGL